MEEGGSMTICIAAVSEKNTDDPRVIIGSDRMITHQMGAPIEYEHTSTKILELTKDLVLDSKCVMMSAGAVSLSESLNQVTKRKISEEMEDSEMENCSIRDIAELCADAYNEVIRDHIQRRVLSTYDMDFDDFKDQRDLQGEFLAHLNNDITEVRREIQNNLISLIVGVDSEGANIFGIRSGTFQSFNRLGYQAIGSGQSPAESVFIHNRYDDGWSLKKSLVCLIEAKKQAEEAQGVGKETDIAIISEGKGIKHLNNSVIEEIEDIYKELSKKQEEIRKKVLRKKEDISV